MKNYTAQEYVGFAEAFDFFNSHLFNNKLPDLLITLSRGSFRGCYISNKFVGRNGQGQASELKLNPDCFVGRPDMDILSTFVHELVHHQQSHQGKPSGSYHNKQFSILMEQIGLQTTADGTLTGKRTGSKMTHLIIPGGKYEKAAEKFLAVNNFKIGWESIGAKKAKSLDTSKIKFVCGECNPKRALWAKVFSTLVCPFCATIYRWADPAKVDAWINEQLSKNKNFQAEIDKYYDDIELAENMIDAMWDALQ